MANRSATLLAPLGGWNARDPLDPFDPTTGRGMPPTDAIRLVNAFPDNDALTVRGGYRVHSTGVGTTLVETLVEYHGFDNTRKLIGAAAGKIYDCSVYGALGAQIATGFSSNQWQTQNFRGSSGSRLIMVNGTDIPQQFDGTAVTAATYSVIATPSSLIHVSAYKNRLYFVQKNSTSIWYGGTNAYTGALTEIDVGPQLKMGGMVIYASSWTQDTGSGLQDLFIIVSNKGEILAYTGSFPGATEWQLTGRYYTSAPLGRRGAINVANDVLILTLQGAIPFSTIINAEDSNYVKLTDKINSAFNDVARLYKDNFGWDVVHYALGKYIAINIPTAAGLTYEQYVINTHTGAWCKFTNQNAVTWCTFNENLYFGGIDGRVYQADYGLDDNGAYIPVDIKWAFNYFGDRTSTKLFTMARPMYTGSQNISFAFDVDTDFTDISAVSMIDNVYSGTAWGSLWGSPWGSDNTATQDWESISGLGKCAAMKLLGRFKGTRFSLSAMNIILEQGGLL